ncbi:peptidase S46 [Sorangium cellulosum]|uniref:Dipeptidyl-peptidase n=1 Tax=Sorangium cellulosum TaxID=56 RepID=A0A150P7W9_SORCE|nr:peptidase S46 [Sorangium cellulosum]
MLHFTLRGHALLALFALSALAPGCGSERPQAGDTKPPASGPGQGAPFENPGGMWLPEQMAQHKDQLEALGLEIDAGALADPTASPLGAVVSLGGCSASFVSADGLIATNHHCSTRALQYNSTPEQDLLTNGYLARTRAEERWAGPTARVFVTRAFRDVTGEVRRDIASIPGDLARYEEIEKRKKRLVAACEEGRPEVRCSIAEYFGGGKVSLIEQLEIKDVRIVYVPHEGIGNFGGDIDNWRWPRHSGDFAFFRAYVGKDNRPASHAEDNVPYRPAHHLKIASAPLNQGDLVMVAGYPGTTNRLRTAAEVESAVSWQYPKRVSFYEESIALLEDLGKRDPEARIKAQPTIQGYSNYLLKTRGMLDGLVEGGLAREKAKLEEELKAWIDVDPARKAAHGGAIEQIAAAYAEHQKTREHDAALSEILSSARLLDAAITIVRMAEERPKADAEREAEFQQRNWERLEQAQVSLQKSYGRTIDQSTFKLAVKRALRLDPKERPALIASLAGGQAQTEAALGAAIDAIYAGTALEDAAARVKLLKTATVDELKESRDPMIRLALEVAPVEKAIEARDKAYLGAMTLVKPRFVEALRAYRGGMLAPDANGTLRVTYGTVRGYKPEIDRPVYRPFTVLSELVKKSTGEPPFNAPEALLDAAREKRFGPYVDDDLGEVPVCFLSDLDITNGNSGSATLNARGELVGLAFDGNYEAMASDWLFMPSITRTIHVDHRYMQWVMDAVSGADAVLKEMGGTPVLQ